MNDDLIGDELEHYRVVRSPGYSDLHLSRDDRPEVTLCGRTAGVEISTAHVSERQCPTCRRRAQEVRDELLERRN